MAKFIFRRLVQDSFVVYAHDPAIFEVEAEREDDAREKAEALSRPPGSGRSWVFRLIRVEG
jgi:hypothetical protein